MAELRDGLQAELRGRYAIDRAFTVAGSGTVVTGTVFNGAVAVGDKLMLWVSGNNVAIDHHAKGKEGVHRLITGSLTYASGDMKEIKLMTPEGERTFAVLHGESKLSGMKEGTPITIELNEAGKVIEIRKAG